MEKPKISHPEKILFPDVAINKQDLANYFDRVSEYMIPHICDRPITLKRYNKGIDEVGFYNKHTPEYFPDFVERLDVPMHSQKGKTMQMAMVDESIDLIYFAGQNVIEIHMGLSKASHLEKPDQVIFDLDPSDSDFEKVRKTAFVIKEYFDKINITSFIKTSGSRGLHIHVPLVVEKTFSDVKAVARGIAEKVQQQIPNICTVEHRKNKRADRVFIDYLRNDYGMTAIAPYSPRARKQAPVATPIEWAELENGELHPQRYTMTNIFRRLGQKDDPWKEFYNALVPFKKFASIS